MRPVPRSAKLLPSAIAISACVLLPRRGGVAATGDAAAGDDATDTAREGARGLASAISRAGDRGLELAADGGFEKALALGLGAVSEGAAAADELDELSWSANRPTPEIIA